MWVNSQESIKQLAWKSFIHKETGMHKCDNKGRTFFEILAAKIYDLGKILDPISTMYTDEGKHTVFFNLNNDKNEIVKISLNSVEVLTNGENNDDIFLENSAKISPIEYNPEISISKGDELLWSLIFSHMACDSSLASLIFSWFASFLLKDFAPTMPIMHFTGSSGSGKTTASKLLSALLYGEERQKKSTVAANYADAMKHPVLFLDNLETENVDSALKDFFLVSSSGISNEKRSIGTNSDVTSETVKCLTNVTGIEPLCPEMPEIVNRVLTIKFDKSYHQKQNFNDVIAVGKIKKYRNDMLSTVFKMTSKSLRMIRDGLYAKAEKLINNETDPLIGQHRRCFPYVTLAYLMYGISKNLDKCSFFDELDGDFKVHLERSINRTIHAGNQSDPIMTVFDHILNGYKNARMTGTTDYFLEKYSIRFDDITGKSEWLKPSLLLGSMKKISKDFNLDFKIRNAAQLGVRLSKGKKYKDVLEYKKNKHTKSMNYCLKTSFIH